MKKFLLLMLVLLFLLGLCASCDASAPVAGDEGGADNGSADNGSADNGPTEVVHDVKVYLVRENYKTNQYSYTIYDASYLLYDVQAEQYHFIYQSTESNPGGTYRNFIPAYDGEEGTVIGSIFTYGFTDLSDKFEVKQSSLEEPDFTRVTWFVEDGVTKYRYVTAQHSLINPGETLVPKYAIVDSLMIHGSFFPLGDEVHMIPFDVHGSDIVLTKLDAPSEAKLSVGEFSVYRQNWYDEEEEQLYPWKELTYTYKYEDVNGDIYYFNEGPEPVFS